MPKIRKKTSKRVGLREKYSCLKKVADHHKKIKKQAKKFAAAGVVPHKAKKGDQIPNSFPNKELLINEMETEFEMHQNELEAKKKEKQSKNFEFLQKIAAGQVEQQKPGENDERGGLTEEQITEAENFMDPEGAQKIRLESVSKKGQWRTIKNVVDISDVLIQVLDARDPEGGRSLEIENQAKENGKKIIFVLNKIDLIPEENASAWHKHYKSLNQLCILDSCKSQNKDDIGEEEKDSAATKLMTILFKYGAKFLEKKQQEQIVVGVIGFTNVGKSSLINQLKQKIVCHTGSSPFITQKMQQVPINRQVLMLDSPGIILQSKKEANTQTQIMRSALQVEEIMFPIEAVEELIQKIEKTEILRFYRIGNFTTTLEMLEQIAKKKGLVEYKDVTTDKIENVNTTKSGKKARVARNVVEKQMVCNVDEAAKRMIRDFLNNRLNHYSKVPQ